MWLNSSETNGDWLAADDLKDQDGEVTERGSRKYIKAFLSECMTTNNLLVLCGLGTSLSINGDAIERGLPTAPTMGNLWAAVRERDQRVFERVLQVVRYRTEELGENIEELLSRCKLATDFLPGDHEDTATVKDFVVDAESVIVANCGFVSAQTELTDHELFLTRIARRSSRKPRTRIFTTNYDQCFEEAARRRRFYIVDGFSPSIPATYDPGNFAYDVVRRERTKDTPDYIENVFHLLKVHGSINWTKENNETVKKDGVTRPLLIYPRSSKYEQAFEPPYLDMMAAFQLGLRQPDTALIIVGFGFNDDHLAKPILSALQANLSLRVLVCDPAFFDDREDHRFPSEVPANVYHKKILGLIRAGDPRVALLRGYFRNFVQELPDLTAENERERHAERFRRMAEYEEGGRG